MKKCLFIVGFALCTVISEAQKISRWKITDVENLMANKDSVLVINFWATFCKPCNHELPYFISTVKKYEKQKVKLVLVSLDLPDYYPARIRSFIKEKKYTYAQQVWLNETNADYFCPKVSEKWSGAIPATIIINNKTGYRKFFEEEMNEVEFENAVKEALKN